MASISTVRYPPAPTDVAIYNPCRGFYSEWDFNATNPSLPTTSDYAKMKSRGNSVILFVLYMEGYTEKPIADTVLATLSSTLATIRAEGMKCVLRVAYSRSENVKEKDASKEWTMRHIDQLRPIIVPNLDVICLLQAGFIGVWGEWYYSKHYGRGDKTNTSQWQDRADILSYLLTNIPNIPILIRVVEYKRKFLNRPKSLAGSPSVTGANAFTDTHEARLGYHNDAFLSDEFDMGTWDNDKEYSCMVAESNWVPMMGETNAPISKERYGVENAMRRLEMEHWSLVNDAYHPEVLKEWRKGGGWDMIRNRLGYRFVLLEADFWNGPIVPDGGMVPGNIYTVGGWNRLFLANEGWARPFEMYRVEVLLVPTSVIASQGAITGTAMGYWACTSIDIRHWGPTATITVPPLALFIPNPSPETVIPGQYEVFINICDAYQSVQSIPSYRVVFANADLRNGAWAKSRINRMNHVLDIEASKMPTGPPQQGGGMGAMEWVELRKIALRDDGKGEWAWSMV
ncbi:hypothetical protein HDV00_005121 [Rhizophlyctis rosea]|nr:hypothetical protein HDV00_005121 [Rhizophlyctis rosea]